MKPWSFLTCVCFEVLLLSSINTLILGLNIRLMDGDIDRTSTGQGRVELFNSSSNSWGVLCFESTPAGFTPQTICDALNVSTYAPVRVTDSTETFGKGEDEVNAVGITCASNNCEASQWNTGSCDADSQVGIICNRSYAFDATKLLFALVGGDKEDNEVNGVVDVVDSANGASGLICMEDIQGYQEAFAVCRNLRDHHNYIFTSADTYSGNVASGTILWDTAGCPRRTSELSDCTAVNGTLYNACQGQSMQSHLGVKCEYASVQLRMNGQNTTSMGMGRIDVFDPRLNLWGVVCEDPAFTGGSGWNLAEMICNFLDVGTSSPALIVNATEIFSNSEVQRNMEIFCSGKSCQKIVWNNESCNANDLGVVCDRSFDMQSSFDVQLDEPETGANYMFGAVRIVAPAENGAICYHSSMGGMEATLLCQSVKQLSSYPITNATIYSHSASGQGILWDGLSCPTGSEALSNCTTLRGDIVNECSGSEPQQVGLRCEYTCGTECTTAFDFTTEPDTTTDFTTASSTTLSTTTTTKSTTSTASASTTSTQSNQNNARPTVPRGPGAAAAAATTTATAATTTSATTSATTMLSQVTAEDPTSCFECQNCTVNNRITMECSGLGSENSCMTRSMESGRTVTHDRYCVNRTECNSEDSMRCIISKATGVMECSYCCSSTNCNWPDIPPMTLVFNLTSLTSAATSIPNSQFHLYPFLAVFLYILHLNRLA